MGMSRHLLGGIAFVTVATILVGCTRYHYRAFLLAEWDQQLCSYRPIDRSICVRQWCIEPNVWCYWGSYDVDPTVNQPFVFELRIVDTTHSEHTPEVFTQGDFHACSTAVVCSPGSDTIVLSCVDVALFSARQAAYVSYNHVTLGEDVDSLVWLIPFYPDYPESDSRCDTICLNMFRHERSKWNLWLGD